MVIVVNDKYGLYDDMTSKLGFQAEGRATGQPCGPWRATYAAMSSVCSAVPTCTREVVKD